MMLENEYDNVSESSISIASESDLGSREGAEDNEEYGLVGSQNRLRDRNVKLQQLLQFGREVWEYCTGKHRSRRLEEYELLRWSDFSLKWPMLAPWTRMADYRMYSDSSRAAGPIDASHIPSTHRWRRRRTCLNAYLQTSPEKAVDPSTLALCLSYSGTMEFSSLFDLSSRAVAQRVSSDCEVWGEPVFWEPFKSFCQKPRGMEFDNECSHSGYFFAIYVLGYLLGSFNFNHLPTHKCTEKWTRPAKTWLQCLDASRIPNLIRFAILSTLARFGQVSLLQTLDEKWWKISNGNEDERNFSIFCWQHVLLSGFRSNSLQTVNVIVQKSTIDRFENDELGHSAMRLIVNRGGKRLLKRLFNGMVLEGRSPFEWAEWIFGALSQTTMCKRWNMIPFLSKLHRQHCPGIRKFDRHDLSRVEKLIDNIAQSVYTADEDTAKTIRALRIHGWMRPSHLAQIRLIDPCLRWRLRYGFWAHHKPDFAHILSERMKLDILARYSEPHEPYDYFNTHFLVILASKNACACIRELAHGFRLQKDEGNSELPTLLVAKEPSCDKSDSDHVSRHHRIWKLEKHADSSSSSSSASSSTSGDSSCPYDDDCEDDTSSSDEDGVYEDGVWQPRRFPAIQLRRRRGGDQFMSESDSESDSDEDDNRRTVKNTSLPPTPIIAACSPFATWDTVSCIASSFLLTQEQLADIWQRRFMARCHRNQITAFTEQQDVVLQCLADQLKWTTHNIITAMAPAMKFMERRCLRPPRRAPPENEPPSSLLLWLRSRLTMKRRTRSCMEALDFANKVLI